MNKIILVGRLTKDPELSATQNSSYVRFNLAVDRRFKRDGDEVTADFPSCIAWGKTAEFIDKYFHKGMKLGLVGRIQTGSYTNRDGQKVYTTDVVAEEVEFVESKNASSGNSGGSGGRTAPPPVNDDDGFMNIPDGIDEELTFN